MPLLFILMKGYDNMIRVINKENGAIPFKDLKVNPGEATTFILRTGVISPLKFTTYKTKFMLKLEQSVSFVDSPVDYNSIDLETGCLYSCSETELVVPADFKLEQIEKEIL